MFSNLLIAVSTTVLNTAGPVIINELGNEKYYSWLFTIYMLFSTITVPIFGKLSDIYGRKKIFIIGLSMFIVSSLFAGLMDSMEWIIFFRLIQGIGAGAILPTAGTIISDLLDVEKRGKFQGYFSVIWGIAAFLGPLVGSFITEFFDWRWIFYVNVPLGIITLLLVLPYKEKIQLNNEQKINWGSSFIFSLAFFVILMSTIFLDYIIPLFLISAVLLLYFYKRDSRAKHPFLSLNILKNKHLLFFNANTFLIFLALFGLESFIPLFLQKIQGIGVLESGFILSGISLGWIISSYPSGYIVNRFGYKKPIIFGNFIILLSTIPFLFYTENTSIVITFAILFIHGICYGLIQTTASIGSYEFASENEKGFANSLQSFSRNIGTTLSLAFMGIFFYLNPFLMFQFSFYATLFAFLFSICMMLLFYKKTN
jgi:MFS family permease